MWAAHVQRQFNMTGVYNKSARCATANFCNLAISVYVCANLNDQGMAPGSTSDMLVTAKMSVNYVQNILAI